MRCEEGGETAGEAEAGTEEASSEDRLPTFLGPPRGRSYADGGGRRGGVQVRHLDCGDKGTLSDRRSTGL